jgi:hypothetical protein
MDSGSQTKPLYENLDTRFVNLWSLLRNLSEKGFVGRVRVDLEDYSADVFMTGSSTPLVREIDRAAGTESLEEAGLHRLVLRVRETPGTINVFEGPDEAAAPSIKSEAPEVTTPAANVAAPLIVSASDEDTVIATGTRPHSADTEADIVANLSAPTDHPESHETESEDLYPTGSYRDWPAILAASGDLIGAIERGVNATGEDFDSLFRVVRLELTDDYTFLDPMASTFKYSKGIASLNAEIPVTDYVSGLSLALRRAVDQVAVGGRARRVRERIAVEMSAVARKHSDPLERSGFQSQLDRIAGTRVI